MAWVEKDHNDHLVSTPCYVQGSQPLDQAAQSQIQPGLECIQEWGIHNLLGFSLSGNNPEMSCSLEERTKVTPDEDLLKTERFFSLCLSSLNYGQIVRWIHRVQKNV